MMNAVAKNYMYDKENKLSNSYYAYLLLFDANNKRERKELLNSIIQDAHSSYLFIKNCQPDTFELDMAFTSVLTDPKYSYLFLKDCKDYINEEQREQVIWVIMQDPEHSYLAAQHCGLTYNERKTIFDRWHENYIKTFELNEFLIYCTTFPEFINDEEKEILVNLVFQEQELDIAEEILKKFELPDFLREKLESMYIMRKLQ